MRSAATNNDAHVQEAVAGSLQQQYSSSSSSCTSTARRDAQQHAEDIAYEKHMQQALAASFGTASDTHAVSGCSGSPLSSSWAMPAARQSRSSLSCCCWSLSVAVLSPAVSPSGASPPP
eukprot:14719-Heterococcus_DN1.PRE.1